MEEDTGYPVQPTEEPTPPALTSATHTLKDAPVEPPEGTLTPYKQSFSQSNQDAIERNEELMSLLACLNE